MESVLCSAPLSAPRDGHWGPYFEIIKPQNRGQSRGATWQAVLVATTIATTVLGLLNHQRPNHVPLTLWSSAVPIFARSRQPTLVPSTHVSPITLRPLPVAITSYYPLIFPTSTYPSILCPARDKAILTEWGGGVWSRKPGFGEATSGEASPPSFAPG